MSSLKLKLGSGVQEYSPTKELLSEDFIGKAILECLLNNDPEGVMEVIGTYLKAVNKVKTAQETNIPRSTLYHVVKAKNPTIRTLAKLMHSTTIGLKRQQKTNRNA